MSLAVESGVEVAPSGVVEDVPAALGVGQVVGEGLVALADGALARALGVQALDPPDPGYFVLFGLELVPVCYVALVVVVNLGAAVALLNGTLYTILRFLEELLKNYLHFNTLFRK